MSASFEQMSPDERNSYFAEAAREYRQNRALGRQLQQRTEFVPAYQKGLVSLTGKELLKREFPPREMLLSPIIPKKAWQCSLPNVE